MAIAQTPRFKPQPFPISSVRLHRFPQLRARCVKRRRVDKVRFFAQEDFARKLPSGSC